ncbi:MAG: L-serine ammonia-lyase, iron-sulfur-dependent subunit beta [Peptoniphilus sp.]|nr:L-serine ammonia-lyase, iron-sulfur-dependent subunit beta [Peptoniphilus sp.]MDD7363208.1 L-serine ammonia-lyase, iron-sulfur-dependent subunit beta [Bacillota bacterium]MDY6044468.1 L-serine ammonia-lyase, iron-sulfur-dependent subunit beta [Peptoniphilus sp.]
MKKYKAFEVIGPVMVGPSSSHTAGACKIGNAALAITEGELFHKVVFRLHGSFASTYKGHGTDLALVAGVLNIPVDDVRLADSFEIARKRGIDFSFEETDLGADRHPNTVEVVFYYDDGGRLSVTGSSIGGGNILIVAINDIDVEFKNEFPTLILQYKEQKGVIASISTILTENEYNIETMVTKKVEDTVTLVTEITESVDRRILEPILNDERFEFAKYVDTMGEKREEGVC